ncbi:MAG: hypothetical protein NTX45_27945 [Proteobacteria bacterium]|nr:hypothetical protein [Pseudomonadota bacterium]
MNTLELIEELEDDLDSIKSRLVNLKQGIWDDTNQLTAVRERMWLLEQLSNPNHDGHPYSDTYGH